MIIYVPRGSRFGIRLVHKKSVRAILAARPAFRGLRIARLVGRANNAEASRRICVIQNRRPTFARRPWI